MCLFEAYGFQNQFLLFFNDNSQKGNRIIYLSLWKSKTIRIVQFCPNIIIFNYERKVSEYALDLSYQILSKLHEQEGKVDEGERGKSNL